MGKASINIDSLYDLPCAVYVKDKKGLYRECNQYVAAKAGLNAPGNILRLCDKDLPWSDSATEYTNNDQLILKRRNSMSFVEDGIIITGDITRSLSYKMPLYSLNNRLLGILGLSFPLNMLSMAQITDFIKSAQLTSITPKKNGLTSRERDIVRLVIRGGTSKTIAAALGLSYRTVENHLASIKLKLAVSSKTELIEKLISII